MGLQTPLPCARVPWAGAPPSLRDTRDTGPAPGGSVPWGECPDAGTGLGIPALCSTSVSSLETQKREVSARRVAPTRAAPSPAPARPSLRRPLPPCPGKRGPWTPYQPTVRTAPRLSWGLSPARADAESGGGPVGRRGWDQLPGEARRPGAGGCTAVWEVVAFELSNACPTLSSQEEEQMVVQTPTGFSCSIRVP